VGGGYELMTDYINRVIEYETAKLKKMVEKS
jgi:hypothetical protein